MRKREAVKTKLGSLKPNPFRAALGKISQDDVDELVESMIGFDWWGGLMGRKMTDGSIELAIGHRRLAAGIEFLGPQTEVKVVVADYSDVEMIQLMAVDNSYRHSTPEERLGIVKAMKSTLEYLSETGQISQAEIVRTLGEKNWPKQRVSELLEQLRTEAISSQVVVEEPQEKTNEIDLSTEESTSSMLDTGTKETHPVATTTLATQVEQGVQEIIRLSSVTNPRPTKVPGPKVSFKSLIKSLETTETTYENKWQDFCKSFSAYSTQELIAVRQVLMKVARSFESKAKEIAVGD